MDSRAIRIWSLVPPVRLAHAMRFGWSAIPSPYRTSFPFDAEQRGEASLRPVGYRTPEAHRKNAHKSTANVTSYLAVRLGSR